MKNPQQIALHKLLQECGVFDELPEEKDSEEKTKIYRPFEKNEIEKVGLKEEMFRRENALQMAISLYQNQYYHKDNKEVVLEVANKFYDYMYVIPPSKIR